MGRKYNMCIYGESCNNTSRTVGTAGTVDTYRYIYVYEFINRNMFSIFVRKIPYAFIRRVVMVQVVFGTIGTNEMSH